MIDYHLDPMTWFGGRLVEMPPRHFVFTPTPISHESKEWVEQTLKGRYSIGKAPVDESGDHKDGLFFLFLLGDTHFYFEDPKEAIVYELTWAG